QINVLPSSQYAPADLREFMAAEGMLNEADGVYWGGEVWVFANKIASPARAEWVMLHEFGHAGLRALFPMEIERRAKFATMLATNPDLQARVARLMEGRPEVQDMIDAVGEVLADAAASGERPSWLMEIVAWLRRHLRKLGLVNTYSDNDILSIVEMGRNRLRRGDRGSLAGAFSRAWHGTNARGIERFSTDFVGAGEGAQAFGWGLYFASKKDVANHYRKKLSDADSYDASFWKDIQLPDDLSVAEYRELNELRQILNDNGYRNGRALTPAESARWRTLMDKQVARASAVEAARPMGQLYEVEVPDDDILLLWDKPLNQQPPKVRAALESTFSEQERRRIAAWKRPAWALEPGDNPAAAYADVVNGSAIYNGMAAAMGSQEAASKALLAAGIKGIKYLDGGSRADGDGSYNYVIFSGDDVEIQRGLFSRIRYSRAGTGGPQARLQALAAAAAEIAAGADSAVARNVRPDLARYDGSPDVLLLWGDDRQGLQKIGARRGATVVADVLRAIARGKVERYTKANRTVVLAHRSARAVLRLERFGQRETWLLTGWEEGKPDESGEVRTQSGPTQRGPTFSRAELGAGLQTSLFPSRSEGNFSRAGTGQVAPAKLAPAGIIDTALRVPMQALGVDKLTRNAGRALTDMLAKFIPEKVKAGVVDDFGLGEVYVDRRALMYGQQRRGLREAKNLYNRIATVSREEAAVLYAAANNADASQVEAMIANLSPEGQAVLREVKQRVQDMGREQVRLGLLSAAAFERNEWAYLRRSYRKYEEAQTEKVRQRRGRAIQVWGDSYIGRGLFDSVDPSKLQGRGWFGTKSKDGQADKQAVGQKFVRLERRKPSGEGVDNLPGIEGKKPRGKLLEAVYWQVGEPIPSQYAEWENAGVWEARDTKGAKVVMWRDFTPDERKQMGEIDDFRYAMLKTMHFATHNVEVGRFLEWVADTQAVPDEDRLPPGAEVREANESLSVTYGRDVWVQVPSSKAGQSDARKYGKLAGQFVPGPIWNDLRQIVRTQHIQPFGELYADVLRFWKISKTALSPVVHMNNVVSNIVMADWHDVTAIDIIRGLRTYLRRDTDAAAKTAFEDFEDAGGTQGLYVLSEIQKDQLEPLLEALEAQLDEAGEARGQVGVLAALQFAMTGRLSDALSAATSSRPGKGVQKAGKLMMDMYEAEDTVFRFAAYLKAIEQGMTAQEAGKIARRSFLDYSINAPWIQLMRNTAFPFVSFVYRAIPMLWDVMQNKPWKLAKLALMIGAANALGYAMSGGDEERERALLPEELSGRVLGVVAPKLVRMPWNDQHGSPVYLDIRRWIPVGDIVDTGATNSAFPILPAMLPGGPLMMLGELLLNQSAFTGREITKESDTLAERGTKVADYLYKAFAPNLPGLPNTWSTESIAAAATGKTDIFGREVSSVGGAALGAIGIKARSYPTDTLAYQAQVRFGAQSREINAEIRSLARQAGRKGITAEEFEEGRLEQVEKLRELEAKLRERLERAAL
ncbi:MAG: hypothetical protein IOD10_16820, partial [Rhodocyclaceae bacterium]|nr:hypothetical protein [Rhodocyclaceae bacterium]